MAVFIEHSFKLKPDENGFDTYFSSVIENVDALGLKLVRWDSSQFTLEIELSTTFHRIHIRYDYEEIYFFVASSAVPTWREMEEQNLYQEMVFFEDFKTLAKFNMKVVILLERLNHE